MKKVTIQFKKAITVEVQEGLTEKEMLKAAEKQVISKLTEKFPGYIYSIIEGNTLTMDTVKIGDLIQDKNNNEYAFITGINKKTIDVVHSGLRLMRGPASCFKAPAEEIEIDTLLEQYNFERNDESKEINWFDEGHVGYLRNKGELIPVVIGKSRGEKKKLYIIGGKGAHYTLTEAQLKRSWVDKKPKDLKK